MPSSGRRPGRGAQLPSGHVILVAALAAVLTPLLPRRWATLPWAAVGLVAFGRVYVGAHNPLDVTAGFGIGLAVGRRSTSPWATRTCTGRAGLPTRHRRDVRAHHLRQPPVAGFGATVEAPVKPRSNRGRGRSDPGRSAGGQDAARSRRGTPDDREPPFPIQRPSSGRWRLAAAPCRAVLFSIACRRQRRPSSSSSPRPGTARRPSCRSGSTTNRVGSPGCPATMAMTTPSSSAPPSPPPSTG